MAKSELEKSKGGKGNSAFKFIEHYNNYVKSTEECIVLVKDSTAAIQKQEEVTLTALHLTANRINEYIDYQKRSTDYTPVKAEVETVFSTLKSTVDTFTKSIAELTQKLDYSAGSINALPGTPALLSDINQNFKDAYNQHNGDIYGKIYNILHKLGNTASATKIAKKIQNFPKPYIDITALYSMRIEKFIEILEKVQVTFLPHAKETEDKKEIEPVPPLPPPFDAVGEFNKWASNPEAELPPEFYYLKNDMMKIRNTAALEESTDGNSKWITNREGTKKYLFPNPNSFTILTDITELYDMDTARLKDKGQNKVKITKPCEMEPNGFIREKGELQLLNGPTPSYREHTVASGASLYNKRESDKPERSIPTHSYRQPPAEGTDSPSSSLYNRRASDKPESGASASSYRQAPAASVISSKTAEPEVNYIRSSLYSSAEQREKRKAESQDVFLDVNQDSYERMLQGENVPLSFEKYGNWSSAPYLLTENNELFLNFHRFNDSKPPVPQDLTKTLNALFEVRGNLPGKVKRCVPAQMTLKGSNYFVSRKGILELGA